MKRSSDILPQSERKTKRSGQKGRWYIGGEDYRVLVSDSVFPTCITEMTVILHNTKFFHNPLKQSLMLVKISYIAKYLCFNCCPVNFYVYDFVNAEPS